MKRPSAKWSKSSETPIGQHLSVIDPNDWSRSGSESVYLLVLASSGSSLIFLTMAKKTSLIRV